VQSFSAAEFFLLTSRRARLDSVSAFVAPSHSSSSPPSPMPLVAKVAAPPPRHAATAIGLSPPLTSSICQKFSPAPVPQQSLTLTQHRPSSSLSTLIYCPTQSVTTCHRPSTLTSTTTSSPSPTMNQFENPASIPSAPIRRKRVKKIQLRERNTFFC
jgi:hypothetical protein